MRDTGKVITALVQATNERLNDPKNVVKGDYPTDLMDTLRKWHKEYIEVLKAVGAYIGKESRENLAHIRYELGDLSAFNGMLIDIIDEKLKEGK